MRRCRRFISRGRIPIRRSPPDRVKRPPAERFDLADPARTHVEVVQRSDAVHAEPSEQRHRTASRGFPPTTTTSRASGGARTSIGGIALCCSAAHRRKIVADLGVGLTMNSAGPYTQTIGAGHLQQRARSGAAAGCRAQHADRRGLLAASTCTSRGDLTGAGPRRRATLTFGVDAFNVTNRVNYGNFVGTISSPLYLQPVNARTPRQLQFSLRFKS